AEPHGRWAGVLPGTGQPQAAVPHVVQGADQLHDPSRPYALLASRVHLVRIVGRPRHARTSTLAQDCYVSTTAGNCPRVGCPMTRSVKGRPFSLFAPAGGAYTYHITVLPARAVVRLEANATQGRTTSSPVTRSPAEAAP